MDEQVHLGFVDVWATESLAKQGLDSEDVYCTLIGGSSTTIIFIRRESPICVPNALGDTAALVTDLDQPVISFLFNLGLGAVLTAFEEDRSRFTLRRRDKV